MQAKRHAPDGRASDNGRWRRLVIAALVALALAACRQSPDASLPSQADQGSAASSATHTPLDRRIRVLLAREVTRFRVAVDGPCDVRHGETGRLLATAERLSSSRVVARGDGPPGLQVGSRWVTGDIVEFVPTSSDPFELTVNEAAGPARYRGFLRCHVSRDGVAELVNVVDIEAYLRSVVRGELPASYHPETFRAQAIAARTYAWYERMSKGRTRNWDVRANESSQVYLGVDREDSDVALAAVRDTAGVVCVWDAPSGRRIFRTYYSSMCGGVTQAATDGSSSEPPGPLSGGVRCVFCEKSKEAHWGPLRVPLTSVTAGVRKLGERYPRFDSMGPIASVKPIQTRPEGRIVLVELTDRAGQSETLTGEQFRLCVDSSGRRMRSTLCRLQTSGDALILTQGRGFGHGLGLCQHGAQYMARRGARAGQILAHYYPGSQLALAYTDAPM